jgi:hypothetical protein
MEHPDRYSLPTPIGRAAGRFEAKTRTIMGDCIGQGIETGWRRAHKHTETPNEEHVFASIESAIWERLDAVFCIDDPQEW